MRPNIKNGTHSQILASLPGGKFASLTAKEESTTIEVETEAGVGGSGSGGVSGVQVDGRKRAGEKQQQQQQQQQRGEAESTKTDSDKNEDAAAVDASEGAFASASESKSSDTTTTTTTTTMTRDKCSHETNNPLHGIVNLRNVRLVLTLGGWWFKTKRGFGVFLWRKVDTLFFNHPICECRECRKQNHKIVHCAISS